MKDSLVAINILVNDNTILNKNGVPLLFYWDGNSDTLINDIYNNDDFKLLIYNSIINVKNYANTKLALFYFTYDNNEEKYNEEISNVQNVLKLSLLDDDTRMFYKNYLWKHFAFLYNSAYHEDYDKEISLFDIDDCILDVYDKIQEKFPKRVIKSTVINYIRSELQLKDNLSLENTDWIINQLEKLLTERK